MVVWIICSYAFILMGELSSSGKISQIGGYGLFLFMFIIDAFRYGGSDMGVYQSQFNQAGQSDWLFWNNDVLTKTTQQFLFFYFNKFFYEMDFGFSALHFCMIAFAMAMMWYLVRHITVHWPIVYALYFIFPCQYDVVQTRNFLMSLFLFYSIWYMSQARRHPYGAYALWNTLGIGFHTAGALNLPFLAFYKIRKWKAVIFPIAAFGLLTPFFYFSLQDMATKVLSMVAIPGTPLEALQVYSMYADRFTPDDTIGNPFKYFLKRIYFITVGTFVVSWLVSWWLIRRQRALGVYEQARAFVERSYAKLVAYICTYFVCVLPLLSYTPSMERYSRNVLLAFYVLLGIAWGYLDKKLQRVLIVAFAGGLLVFVLFSNSHLVTFTMQEYAPNGFFDLFDKI